MSDVSIPSFRVTAEDLPDLDVKTREALQPLLESLNISLQQLSQLPIVTPSVISPGSRFTADSVGAADIELRNPLAGTPSCVLVASIQREDGEPIDVAYGFWWGPTSTGLRVVFSDLEPLVTHFFSVRVQ